MLGGIDHGAQKNRGPAALRTGWRYLGCDTVIAAFKDARDADRTVGGTVGILLAGLGTFRKDFIFATPFLTQAWLFITPVIYPLSSVPEKWRSIYMLNPMVGVIEGFRSVLIKGQSPEIKPLVLAMVMVILIMSISWPLFRKLSDYFADVL